MTGRFDHKIARLRKEMESGGNSGVLADMERAITYYIRLNEELALNKLCGEAR